MGKPRFMVKAGSRIVYETPEDPLLPYKGFEVQAGEEVEVLGVVFYAPQDPLDAGKKPLWTGSH